MIIDLCSIDKTMIDFERGSTAIAREVDRVRNELLDLEQLGVSETKTDNLEDAVTDTISQLVTLAQLSEEARWVAWRRETRDGKSVKVPYHPRTGELAQCNNPATWATRSEAEWWVATELGDGVGIVLGPVGDADLCGINLDSRVDAGSGEVAEWAQEIVDRINSYCEISPSRGGIKVFVRAPQAEQAAIDAIFGGQSRRRFTRCNSGDHPPAIELYRSNTYFAVTGDSISN
jgi:primase-polymerase (primpol)-like protein